MMHDLEKLRLRLAREVGRLATDLARVPEGADQLHQVELVLRDAIETVRRTRVLVRTATQTVPAQEPNVTASTTPGISETTVAMVPVMVTAPPDFQQMFAEHFADG